MRISISVTGFVPYRGPEFSLQPGEMRFVKVVMKKAAPKQPNPGGGR